MRRARLQKEAARLVRAGYSFNQTAEQIGVTTPTVHLWMKSVGVSSPANSKWSDLSHRAPTARKVREAGGTWQDVADTWASIEGFVVSGNSAWQWTRKNAPEIISAGKSKLPASVRSAIVAAYGAGASA
jgi:hypothetical protein